MEASNERVYAIATNIAAFCQHAKPLDEISRFISEFYYDQKNNLNFDGYIQILGYKTLLNMMVENSCFYKNFDVYMVPISKGDTHFKVYARYNKFSEDVRRISCFDFQQEVPANAVQIKNHEEWIFLETFNQPNAIEGRLEMVTHLVAASNQTGRRNDWIPIHIFDTIVREKNWSAKKKEYFPNIGGQMQRIIDDFCFKEVELTFRGNNIPHFRLRISKSQFDELQILHERASKFWNNIERFQKEANPPPPVKPFKSHEQRRRDDLKALKSKCSQPVSYMPRRMQVNDFKVPTEYSRIQSGRIAAISVSDDSSSDEGEGNKFDDKLSTLPLQNDSVDSAESKKVAPPKNKVLTMDEILSSSDEDEENDENKNDQNEEALRNSNINVPNETYREEEFQQVSSSDSDSDSEKKELPENSAKSLDSATSLQKQNPPPSEVQTNECPSNFDNQSDSVSETVKDDVLKVTIVPFFEEFTFARFDKNDAIRKLEERLRADQDLETLKSAEITLPDDFDATEIPQEEVFKDAQGDAVTSEVIPDSSITADFVTPPSSFKDVFEIPESRILTTRDDNLEVNVEPGNDNGKEAMEPLSSEAVLHSGTTKTVAAAMDVFHNSNDNSENSEFQNNLPPHCRYTPVISKNPATDGITVVSSPAVRQLIKPDLNLVKKLEMCNVPLPPSKTRSPQTPQVHPHMEKIISDVRSLAATSDRSHPLLEKLSHSQPLAPPPPPPPSSSSPYGFSKGSRYVKNNAIHRATPPLIALRDSGPVDDTVTVQLPFVQVQAFREALTSMVPRGEALNMREMQSLLNQNAVSESFAAIVASILPEFSVHNLGENEILVHRY